MAVPEEPDSKLPPSKPEMPGDSSTETKRPLTPEEQMEQFEESLKESDWGHQPC